MSTLADASGFPEFKPWSIAAVKLLQGVVYHDDHKAWDILLASQPALARFLVTLGLELVIDEADGMAYVRQLEEGELPDEYQSLPKLYRKTRLGYDQTLMCVVLRSELLRYELEDVDSTRCVVYDDRLYEEWRMYFPAQEDEVRGRREMTSVLRKLEEIGFVKRIKQQDAWEIRKILKARLPAAELENLKTQLTQAAAKRSSTE
jgi:hypothetical protein